MTTVEIVALRLELSRCRQRVDHELGTAMMLLDRAETAAREAERVKPAKQSEQP